MTDVLRAVRLQRAMTLEDLAEATGLTKSYLSKVERRQSIPSIAAAMKIARALEVDVARLFADDPEASAITVERAIDHHQRRHHAVATHMLGKAMSPFVVHPGPEFAEHPHSSHPGQEFVFVHAGEVELSYDGQVIALNAGDCAYFDASVPHKFRRCGADPAVVVVVAYSEVRRSAG
ncbi:MAG: XRE family transcriptional regulator [Mycobacterium sp.]